MEEAVEAFVKTRTAALELARNGGAANAGPKRKAENDHHESDDAPEGKRPRTSTRPRRSQTNTPSYAVPTEEDEVVEVPDDDDDYVPEPGKINIFSEEARWDTNHVIRRRSCGLSRLSKSDEGVASIQASRNLHRLETSTKKSRKQLNLV